MDHNYRYSILDALRGPKLKNGIRIPRLDPKTTRWKLRVGVIFMMMVGLIFSLAIPITGTTAFPQNFRVALAASDPVIATAGDIACDPSNSSFNSGNGTSSSCRQKYTSDLLVNTGLSAVLDLGDNQYYCGGYQAYLQSYDLSWGRVKSITHPSVGNHEYLTSGGTDCNINNTGAAGYFEYFGTAAGTQGQGYYSFDIGTWHIIVLNTNCSNAGGCSSSSPQYAWLQNDLATHSNYCTLAYWHIPLFSSGGRASSNSKPFWQLLYNYNADLILSGHDHIYERFAPQDPNGVLDLTRGIREFVVGTGGANHTSIAAIVANSEVRNTDTYGVMKLTLHPTSYDWQFVPEAGKTFTDSGTQACHGGSLATPTATQATLATNTPTPLVSATPGPSATSSSTPTPLVSATPSPSATATFTSTPQSPILFSDGFESGTLANWTKVQGLVVQTQQVASGTYAARGTSILGGATYARKQLATAQSDVYYRISFKVLSQGVNNVNLMKFRTVADKPILSVEIDSLGHLNYHNDITGSSVISATTISQGAWQTLQVHVHIANAASQIEVWYNNLLVSDLSRSDAFGTNPIGRLQLGEDASGLTYDVAFDDVTASTAIVATPTPAPTSTATSILDSTQTPTPTATATVAPVATNTPVLVPTSTATSAPLATNTPTPLLTLTATVSASQSITFTPLADTYVNSGSPTSNYGSSTTLRADGSPDVHSYLRFSVTGLGGKAVVRARLLIFANSSLSQGINALAVADNTWGELTTTYDNAPVLGNTLATSGAITTGTWVTLDVTPYITGEGTISIGVNTASATAISLASRESGANSPQLIVDLQ